MALLEVRNLHAAFPSRTGLLPALRGVGFALEAGERLGIVGESGAGKSLAAFAILNLLPEPGRITAGEIVFKGRDLLTMPAEDLRQVRGGRIAMIFQDPMTTLNPVMTVGEQMTECLAAHRTITRREARQAAVAKLREVAMPSPEARLNSYPHELSGGMRQRVVIATALLTDPELIIADEPTTALDVTIQAEIIDLLAALCRRRGMALILITHDLGLVAQATERAAVMYAGRIAEIGDTAGIIGKPCHPYTRGLLGALPDSGVGRRRFRQIPGSMPPISDIPAGCAFHPRCEWADDICRKSDPPPERELFGRVIACHFAEKVAETTAGSGHD